MEIGDSGILRHEDVGTWRKEFVDNLVCARQVEG